MKKRASFTREFKLEAVRLLERGHKPAADLARELGIYRNQLYKWQEQLSAKGKEDAFPGHGRRAGSEAEVARLRRENEHLKEENAILKKAAVYFAGHGHRAQAAKARPYPPHRSGHTDQGILYATANYRAILKAHHMLPSMSKKGDCYDNAVAESFFSGLKQ